MVVLRSDATAYDAARAMFANHVGAVLVVEDGELTGIVTDRDLALRAGPRLALSRLPVREVMTPHPITIEPTNTFVESGTSGRRTARHRRASPAAVAAHVKAWNSPSQNMLISMLTMAVSGGTPAFG